MAVDDFPVSCPFGNFHCNLLNKCWECLDQVYKPKEIGVRICVLSEDSCKAADCPQHGIFKQTSATEAFRKEFQKRAEETVMKSKDHLREAYEATMELAFRLRKAIYERDGNKEVLSDVFINWEALKRFCGWQGSTEDFKKMKLKGG